MHTSIILLGLVAYVLSACESIMPRVLSPASGNPGPDLRPNVVFITTDDQDVGLLPYMPRVQHLLVDQGVSFTNAFVTVPFCSPSHVTMITGQYAHNHGVTTNGRFLDLGGEQSTLGTWLQNGGYRTGRVGKYLVGYGNRTTHVPPGWDDWHAFYGGWTAVGDYALNENGSVVQYGNTEADYVVDVLTNRAVAFLEERDPRPFFLFFAPPAPHSNRGADGPPTPAIRHQGLYSDITAPRPASFNEGDMSDKPAAMQSRPALTEQQVAEIDAEHQARAESLLAVDEAVERLIHALAATGHLDRTYLIFTSDNGYHLGQHRLVRGKGTFFEEDIRVPLIVRGPGIAPGGRRDHLVLNLDVAPTIAELSEVSVDRTMDGRSLVPLLRGTPPPRTDWRGDFLIAVDLGPAGGPRGGDQMRALRTENWVYVEYAVSGARQLYDLRADPDQVESLHEVAPPEVIGRLSSRLHELAACAGETCQR